MNFSLTILGVNSATPAHGRFPTSQVLQVHNQYFLIDCGEGCQMRLSEFDIPRQKIHQVFISHLHGDHVFGLPGLLFSYTLNDRREPLHIFSPPGLEEMIMAQLNPGGALSFPLFFHQIDATESRLVFENEFLSVQSIPLRHRIPTTGFLFKEKPRPLNIRPEKIGEYQLSIPQIKAVKRGEDILLDNGRTIPNAELTVPPPAPRSYAYISDTVFDESIVPLITGVDLLYHETTFQDDMQEYAALTMHSTSGQAAQIAKKAKAGKLITGHYSSRYKDLSGILEEARAVFQNTVLGMEGERYEVG